MEAMYGTDSTSCARAWHWIYPSLAVGAWPIAGWSTRSPSIEGSFLDAARRYGCVIASSNIAYH